MNQEYPRPFLGGADMGFTRTSTATSFSHPMTRIPTNSDQHVILMDNEPQNYNSSNENDDDEDFNGDLAAPLTRDYGYSRPFLFLDMIWNLAFVVVSVFVLLTTIQERPSTPLRMWICGYALQCLLHVGFVWDEYQRRSLDDDFGGGGQYFHFRRVFSFSAICHNSIIKKLESINTIVSSVWWVFGFYWTVMGGQPLLQDSPRLYWLSVVFLAFDVFFMIFCIAMACIIFFLLFCCFPILATVAYAMTIGDGASENDIRSLPKYLYRQKSTNETFEDDKKREVDLKSLPGNGISTAELVLHPEDSECCICLYKYVNGAELCTLPCNHHFHHKCVTKWLRINATCPLCKFNILKGEMLA
ncbi:Anaphase-promoting complex (APC), subunit 11 [Handroanthus impetiginosus]|uniref:RING-type E3 ubiquitin transferase n=1 Tax=Handroanthus impetiginosus TaxID=429701 RepID=A0A2G9HMW0_9LAMI|nr:Anaphase-promoting complex (APC), subunit 11 [Handroanthus impetiginosus]